MEHAKFYKLDRSLVTIALVIYIHGPWQVDKRRQNKFCLRSYRYLPRNIHRYRFSQLISLIFEIILFSDDACEVSITKICINGCMVLRSILTHI